jgi:hypothetical protein
VFPLEEVRKFKYNNNHNNNFNYKYFNLNMNDDNNAIIYDFFEYEKKVKIMSRANVLQLL